MRGAACARRQLNVSSTPPWLVQTRGTGLKLIKPARQFLAEDIPAFNPNLLSELVWEP
jgi:hypothetical protein